MKKKLKKLTSFVLAFGMICSLTPSSVWAEGTASPTDSSIVETSEESTEETTETTTEITTEATTEGVTEETTEAPAASEENEDAESTEDAMYIVFDHAYSDADLSTISTAELFVETSDASVFTKNTNVVSNYDDAYILSFDSVEEARFAYSYYIDKVDFITDMSNVVSLAENTDDKEEENLDSEELKEDEEDSANSEENKKEIANEETEAVEQAEDDKADLSDVNKNSDDAIANMNDIDTKNYKGYIALIDSGCKEADAKLSVFGDDGSDSVGHGSRMYEYIKEENPDAKVLSIKAFNGNTTNVADVYAAIKLAIDNKVSVINLSFTALNIEKNEILKSVIQEALDNNIIVIGAAGNTASSATNYIPGCIEKVTTVGAVNEDGTLYQTSNFDADLYVVAESTSEATSRYSGIYTSGNESDKVYTEYKSDNKEEIDIEDADIDNSVYTTDKTYLVKYLYVDKDMISGDETINDIYEKAPQSVIYQSIENVAVYKQNNIYMFYADTPWKNKLTSGDVLDYTFANANYNGEEISEGVKFDTDSKIAYVDENAFENEAFANGQLQILVPIDKNAQSNITVNIYNLNGDKLYTSVLDVDAFNPLALTFSNINNISSVEVNGKEETNYTFNNGLFALTGKMGIDVSTIDITSDIEDDIILAVTYTTDKATLLADSTCPTYYVSSTSYKDWGNVGNWGSFTALLSSSASSSNVTKTPQTIWYSSSDSFYTYNNSAISPTNAISYYVAFPYTWYLGTAVDSSGQITSYEAQNTKNSNYYKYFHAACAHVSASMPAAVTDTEATAWYKVVAEYQNPYNEGYDYKLISILTTPIAGTATSGTAQAGLTNIWVKAKNRFYRSYKVKKTGENVEPVIGCDLDVYDATGTTKIGDMTDNGDGTYTWESEWLTEEKYEQITIWEVKGGTGKTSGKSYDNPLNNNKWIQTSGTVGTSMTKFNTHKWNDGDTIPTEYTVDTTNTQPTTHARFQKVSSNPSYTNGNPNYDMSQAKFTVYKDSGKTQALGTVQCNKTDNYSDWLDLSSHMNATGTTTFYYKETTMPKGCENSVPAEGSFTLSASNTEYTAVVGNTGGADLINLKIDKLDSTGSKNMYGNNTLEGAEFTVKFYPQNINGNLDTSVAVKPEHVWVFQTKKNDADPDNPVYELYFDKTHRSPSCTNDTYFNSNGRLHVPYGFITIQETKAPTGYKTNGDFKIGNVTADANGIIVFKVTPNGEEGKTASGTYSAVADDGTILKKDTPIRADLIIKKLDHNGDNMTGVQFEIKCNETQEKVVVVTDDEGKFCTATTYAAHGYKTNSGEAKSGTWFGNQNFIDESLGALYEGTYTITELRCEANKGKQLEKPITISVNASNDASIIPVYDANAADAQEFIYNYPMPEIHTDALVKETGSKSMGQVGAEEDGSQIDYSNQTIVDDMEYKYLRAGTSFVVLAELMVIDPETGNVTPYTEKDASGNDIPYKRIKSFSTDANYDYSRYEKEGHVTIELDGVDPTGLEGKKFVVYETVYLDDTRNPYTKVEDLPDDDNALQYDGYADLVDDQGNNISEMYFFPLRHNDPDDTRQQVYPADLHTTAMGKETGDHVGYVGTETFIDRVFYTGLSVGQQYTINGLVYIKDDAKDIKDATVVTDKDGQPVKATKTFTAEQSEGYVDIEFTIPAEDLMGERIVCVEDVWQDKIRLALHADINDSDEIYYIPEIHTSTRNGKVDKTKITDKNKDSAKEVCASAEGDSFIDTISYSSLISNREFKVVGTLMDKATGEPMKDAKGNVIKAETTFKTKEVGEIKITDSPDAKDYLMADGTVLDMSADHADYLANGSVDLEFKGFDFTTLANKTGVVYEEVYLIKTDAQGNKKEYLVGDHKKLDDIDQFVYFVQIGTQAQDQTTGIQVAPRNTKTKIKDTISFHGCIVGKTYEFTATFRVKNDTSGKYKDGDILLGADGKPVTASAKYTPTTKDGEAVVEIELDTSVLESSEIVCFESMKNELGIEIACHNDLEDSSQKIEIPGGKTKATDKDGKKTVKANSKVTIYDKLSFTNLQPGKEYTATGTLMLKETGEALTDANGNKVTNTVKFTPTEKDGYVTIPFEVDTSMLGGKTIVVYEDVYYQDVPLFIEHNINDEDQSITVTPPTTPPKTGMIILFTIIGLMAVGGAGMLIFRRKRA